MCFIISVPRVEAQTTCPSNLLVQNVNNQSGLIQSSLTTTYSSNMDCEWTLSADTKLELVFVNFTTESNADFVYVYDGNSSSARLIGRFSGSSRPGPSVSSSNQLHVRFTSNNSSEHYGFKATYGGMFSFFSYGHVLEWKVFLLHGLPKLILFSPKLTPVGRGWLLDGWLSGTADPVHFGDRVAFTRLSVWLIFNYEVCIFSARVTRCQAIVMQVRL